MSTSKRLVFTLLLLLVLTLISTLLAETSFMHPISNKTIAGLCVCFIIALKGRLVIDHFIGLRGANKHIRAAMLAYFYILPLLIGLAMIFPGFFVQITSVG